MHSEDIRPFHKRLLNCFVKALHSFPLRWLHILPVWPSGQTVCSIMRLCACVWQLATMWVDFHVCAWKWGKGKKMVATKAETSSRCEFWHWEDSLDASPEPPVITCTERLIDLIFVHYSHICLSYNRVEWDSQRHCSCITAGSPVCSHGCYVWRS